MFCPKCGKGIPDGSKFCQYCGAKITNEKKEKRKTSKLRIILPIVIVLVLLFSSLAVYQVLKPRIDANKEQEVATLIPYRKGDKWGFCDRNKKLVIPAVYDMVWPFSEGLAAVYVNGKYGYIDTKGNLVIPAVYDDAWPFSEGLATVGVDGKYGFIDTKGNMATQAIYDWAGDFSNGLACVKVNGKYGFIDTKGNIVIPAVYDEASDFSNGLARVEVNGKFGFIDTKGNIVIPAVYGLTDLFSEGLVAVRVDGNWGFIDTKGNIVIPTVYFDVWDFSEGLARVEVDSEWGYIDTKGNIVIPTVYDDASDFSDGLAVVEVNGKYGYIDTKGNMVIPAVYDDAWDFSEGLAAVAVNGKLGYIDTKGNIVIPAVYDDVPNNVWDFSQGLALVVLNGEWGYIDTKGTQYWEVAPSAPTDTTPSAPTGVTATAGKGQVTISWNAVSGATSYNIYWSTTSGVTKTNGIKIANATSPYLHKVSIGTEYYYIVTAVNSSGESVESAQVSIAPMVLPSGITLRVLPGYTLSACIDTYTGKSHVNPQTLMAAGGSPFERYTWSTKGLPSGTTIYLGVFKSNGMTLIAGQYKFTIEVSDGTSTATGSVTLNVTTVSSAPSGGVPGVGCPLAILQQYPSSSFALDDANANKPYGASLFAMGGTPPYIWIPDTSYSEMGDFNLSGLTIDRSSGIVRGTPSNSSSGKTLKFRVIVKDSAGDSASGPVYTITVR
jgi:predicted nucleic acid-binding Zn ribbon protein